MRQASPKYAPEVRERAVRMVFEHEAEQASQRAAISSIALHDRRPVKGSGLVHHSDRGSQYFAMKYTGSLTEAGVGRMDRQTLRDWVHQIAAKASSPCALLLLKSGSAEWFGGSQGVSREIGDAGRSQPLKINVHESRAPVTPAMRASGIHDDLPSAGYHIMAANRSMRSRIRYQPPTTGRNHALPR